MGIGQASVPVQVLHVSGIPQGSVLGPILFIILKKYLIDKIVSSVCLFTDDSVLYGNIWGRGGGHIFSLEQ